MVLRNKSRDSDLVVPGWEEGMMDISVFKEMTQVILTVRQGKANK